MEGRWSSPVTSVSTIIKTNSHNIMEVLLKVALITITLTLIDGPLVCEILFNTLYEYSNRRPFLFEKEL